MKTSTGKEIPEKPVSLADSVAFVDDRIYVVKSKAFDSVFLSWYQRCRAIDNDIRMATEEADAVAKYLAQEKSAQPKTSQAIHVDDAINMEKARALLVKVASYGASDMHLLIRETHAEVQVRIKSALRLLEKMSVNEGKLLERTLFQGFASSKDASFKPQEYQNAQIDGADVHPVLTGIRMVRGPCYPMEKNGSFVIARFQYVSSRITAPNPHGALPYPARPNKESLQLNHLGYTDTQVMDLVNMVESTAGIILVTGPTGSGKTTLLNEMMKRHAYTYPELRQVTIEDPIEYPMPWAVQLPITNAANEDATADAFSERLRTALRMDPDCILLGEVRGAGSALAALNAAMTGHLVFATLHTSDPYMAIDRMELMDPIRLNRKITCDHRLVLGLIAQRLLPKLCPHCKQPFNPDKVFPSMVEKLAAWGDVTDMHEKGTGCDACSGDGYVSRFAVGEVVSTNSEFMTIFIKDGGDAARKYMRYREGFGGSMLFNTMRHVCTGEVSPYDIRMAATLMRPGEET